MTTQLLTTPSRHVTYLSLNFDNFGPNINPLSSMVMALYGGGKNPPVPESKTKNGVNRLKLLLVLDVRSDFRNYRTACECAPTSKLVANLFPRSRSSTSLSPSTVGYKVCRIPTLHSKYSTRLDTPEALHNMVDVINWD